MSSPPTQEELKSAFANLHVANKANEAAECIYRATQNFAGLARQFSSVEVEFEDIVSIAMVRLLSRNRPIIAEAPYALLKLTLTRLYLDELRKSEQRAKVQTLIECDVNDARDLEDEKEPAPIDERLILDDLVTQILPGRCGKMKDVPKKVEQMYHTFQEVRLSGKQVVFSTIEKKEHERIRKKVHEIVNQYVAEDSERRRFLGFTKAFLRLRSRSENTANE